MVDITTTILTRGGQYFNFMDPTGYRLDIKDIAHGLSNQCRFGGHTREFYSVAQHSIYLSHIVPEEHAFAGLMHDAAEAFIGDCPSPLKQVLHEYRRIERVVEAFLFERLGIAYPLPASVKQADLVMLATERKRLMPADDTEWPILKGIEPHGGIIICPLTCEEAYVAFIERYEELTGNYITGPAISGLHPRI